MKRYAKAIETITFGMAILICATVSPFIISAYDGRTLYSLQQMNEDVLGDEIVFNSIEIIETDYTWYKNTYGKDLPKGIITNETNFVGARENTGTNIGVDNLWEPNQIRVEDGKTYFVRIYAHNDNPNGEKAISENTRVSFNIPSASDQEIAINGYIYSDTAVQDTYLDNIVFKSETGENFHLEYVWGSALLENLADYNTITTDDGRKQIKGFKLSDDIVNAASVKGVKIGYKLGADGQPNGQVPGGYQYDSYTAILVKAYYDYDYTIETLARLEGQKEWQKTVKAKVGDKVEFQIQYKNTSDFTQEMVAIKNILPDNLKFVPEAIKFRHADENGNVVTDHLSGDYLLKDGLAIGSYTAGSNAYLMFTAEVVDNSLDYGSNTLVNWAQAGVGEKVIQDYARVHIQKKKGFLIWRITITLMILLCLIAIIVLTIKTWNKIRYGSFHKT